MSAYSSTSPPAKPGCRLSSHPTTSIQFSLGPDRVLTGSLTTFIVLPEKRKASEFFCDLLHHGYLRSSFFRSNRVQRPASLIFVPTLCTTSLVFSATLCAASLAFTPTSCAASFVFSATLCPASLVFSATLCAASLTFSPTLCATSLTLRAA